MSYKLSKLEGWSKIEHSFDRDMIYSIGLATHLRGLVTHSRLFQIFFCFAFLGNNILISNYNVPVCSGTQKEQHQDSFSNMAVFLFKSCYTKRYCACLISMCFCGMLHHTCITCHNIHHISPFTTYCFS